MKTKYFGRRLSLFNIFFLTLGGYYAVLILVSNLLSNSISRYFTVPIRVIVVLSIIYIILNSSLRKRFNLGTFFFNIFSLVYIVKIMTAMMQESNLYMPSYQFLLYFLSFVFIPFSLVRMIEINKYDYERIFKITVFGSTLVAILTYFFYGDLLGKVERISHAISADENSISPLALSYTSVLGITLCFSYLITRRISVKNKVYLYIVMLVCLVPFFLGASRGSVFSFVFTIVIYFLASKGAMKKIKIILAILLIFILLFFISNSMGTSVFDRVFNISSEIDSNNPSAIRLFLWESSFFQFVDYPIFGNGLQLEVAKHHPHNILIEVLMSTGFSGFVPFLLFLICIFMKTIRIIRVQPQMFWLTNIFTVSFIMNMFSGAIWGASWLALGAALIAGYDINSKRDN